MQSLLKDAFSKVGRPLLMVLAVISFSSATSIRAAEQAAQPNQALPQDSANKPAEIAEAATRVTLVGHIPPHVKATSRVGLMEPTKEMRLVIGLPLRDHAKLKQRLKEISDPKSPDYRHYLTPEKFRELYSPSERDYERVLGFAKEKGLRVNRTYANRVVIDVRAPVATIQKAFDVDLIEYKRADGTIFHAPSREPSVERDVPILHISGLNDFIRPHPNYRVTRLKDMKHHKGDHPFNGSGPSGEFGGKDFRNAYAPGVILAGAGQSIGLVEFDGFFAEDIKSYRAKFGLPDVLITSITLDGFDGAAGINNAEVALDIEMCICMCPALANILVFEVDSHTHVNSILAAMVSPHDGVLPEQISCSWGFDGDDTSQELINEMAAQGQSFFAASGDSGAYSSDPDDDRTKLENVTIVGGTRLTLKRDGSFKSETTWPDSGGGIGGSNIPDYQVPFKMTANHGSTRYRNLPDVSAVADNIFVIADNGDQFGGVGTSFSTPIWAGWMALANEQAKKVGAGKIGFANPALYTIAEVAKMFGKDFHDINDKSTNTSTNDPSHFSAVAGYDLATGLGSPTAKLIDDLAPTPPKTRFSSIKFIIMTGGDDCRDNSAATATLHSPDGTTLDTFTLKRKDAGSWDNYSMHELTFALSHPISESQFGDLTISLIQGGSWPETEDNWNIETLDVILFDPGATQKSKISLSGDPIIRLTGSKGSQMFAASP